jgi:hypothetical protein
MVTGAQTTHVLNLSNALIVRIVDDTTDISALKQALLAFQSQLAKLEQHQERTPDRTLLHRRFLLLRCGPEGKGQHHYYLEGHSSLSLLSFRVEQKYDKN